MYESIPVTFDCHGATLLGIVEQPAAGSNRAVLIVVGGPQYRVGSHRQFVTLARELAARGTPVLRFDHRGVGDSDGEITFDRMDADIRVAIDALCARIPNVDEVVIWGLCDAASAAMMYAHTDERVAGLVLLNPWVRSEEGLARSYVSHYYTSQLLNGQFWKRLLTGKVRVIASLASLFSNLRRALWRPARAAGSEEVDAHRQEAPFQARMEVGMARFRGPVLLVLSGNDITATEFKDHASRSRRWREIMNRDTFTTRELPDANHTFSTAAWRGQVVRWTQDWLTSW